MEQKLATLPYIEDIPVPSNEHSKLEQIVSSSHLSYPFSFFRVDLRGQDLSHRFLQHADFRETHLENANFYMTDLTGASFKGASLSDANLPVDALEATTLPDFVFVNLYEGRES